jgi:hypothetical protein
MTPEGYPALLRFVERDAKVKATAFDRVSEGLDVAQTLRHRFAYAMVKWVPLHCLAQIMGHDSLNTRIVYILGTQGIDNGQSRSERGCEEAPSGHVAWERRKVAYV